MHISEHELTKLLNDERITTYFQPIINLKSKKIVGVEALSRGLTPEGNIIPPIALFEAADEYGVNVVLDRLCRKKAMENFAKLGMHEEIMLFLNLDGSILDQPEHKSHHFTKTYADTGKISYQSVAVEIVESEISNTDRLGSVVNNYKELGILVVLDDFGALHSNLNRLIVAKPDIIKLDRELVDGINDDYYKQAVVKSIRDMAEKIGAKTLAEGVETQEDVACCYKLGIDLYQGFYFSKPKPLEDLNQECCKTKMEDVASYIKERVMEEIELNRESTFNCDNIMGSILSEINSVPKHMWHESFLQLISKYSLIECVYILDENGRQWGPTICNDQRKRSYGKLYSPSQDGTDHSLKDYYLYLRNLNIDKFYTDPYISMATGYLCRTLSRKIKNKDKENLIVCVDFIETSTCAHGL